ncbi:MAG: hypothetical protein QOF78_1585 [Phycisphaerales bacterium]|jgi:hypothetical protein|nr:hypothetical protein [Phycisphaerales bacterium]
MTEMSDHCPFLNRSDERCSESFTLDHLGHAFKYCFDRYQTCPVYAQQLAERQGRRAAAAGAVRHVNSSSNSSSTTTSLGSDERAPRAADRAKVLVSISLPARYAQPQRAA